MVFCNVGRRTGENFSNYGSFQTKFRSRNEGQAWRHKIVRLDGLGTAYESLYEGRKMWANTDLDSVAFQLLWNHLTAWEDNIFVCVYIPTTKPACFLGNRRTQELGFYCSWKVYQSQTGIRFHHLLLSVSAKIRNRSRWKYFWSMRSSPQQIAYFHILILHQLLALNVLIYHESTLHHI